MPVVPPPAHLLATPPAVDPAQVVEPVSVQEVEGAPSLEELALDASSETATVPSSIEEPTAERGN